MGEVQSALFREDRPMKITITYEPDGSWYAQSPDSIVVATSGGGGCEKTRESALKGAEWLFSMERDRFSTYEID